jgi:hypothetical protein
VLVAVTDHAADRFRQRVRGTLDPKREIIARVARGHAAGRVARGEHGAVLVRDVENRDLVYVCRPERDELVVITLWEEGESPAVPRRFTDALEPRRSGRHPRQGQGQSRGQSQSQGRGLTEGGGPAEPD